MIATDVVDPIVIAASHGKADGKHDEGLSQGEIGHGSHLVGNAGW